MCFRSYRKLRAKNRSCDITGVLAITQGRFFQAIEGPRDKVEALMNVIEKDRRHHSISVLVRRPISERQFPDWSMRRFEIDDVAKARSHFRTLLALHKDARTILQSFEAFIAHGERLKG